MSLASFECCYCCCGCNYCQSVIMLVSTDSTTIHGTLNVGYDVIVCSHTHTHGLPYLEAAQTMCRQCKCAVYVQCIIVVHHIPIYIMLGHGQTCVHMCAVCMHVVWWMHSTCPLNEHSVPIMWPPLCQWPHDQSQLSSQQQTIQYIPAVLCKTPAHLVCVSSSICRCHWRGSLLQLSFA